MVFAVDFGVFGENLFLGHSIGNGGIFVDNGETSGLTGEFRVGGIGAGGEEFAGWFAEITFCNVAENSLSDKRNEDGENTGDGDAESDAFDGVNKEAGGDFGEAGAWDSESGKGDSGGRSEGSGAHGREHRRLWPDYR